jgi:hypothetical protein
VKPQQSAAERFVTSTASDAWVEHRSRGTQCSGPLRRIVEDQRGSIGCEPDGGRQAVRMPQKVDRGRCDAGVLRCAASGTRHDHARDRCYRCGTKNLVRRPGATLVMASHEVAPVGPAVARSTDSATEPPSDARAIALRACFGDQLAAVAAVMSSTPCGAIQLAARGCCLSRSQVDAAPGPSRGLGGLVGMGEQSVHAHASASIIAVAVCPRLARSPR